MPTTTREIHLASRPRGWPSHDDFRLVTTKLSEPGPGEVLVRNTHISVDPYMRGRMNDMKSYVPPYALDAPMDGGAVGEVIASGDDSVRVGDVVRHQAGWREHALLPAGELRRIEVGDDVPPTAYLGVLGMPGLTAYVGLTRIARIKEGDTVFVSGAAGAVGSLVGQMARHLGARRVIGSAGSKEKVEWLTAELGFDVAFDYHDGPVVRTLGAALDGDTIDVYFDNVGGEHLEAAIAHMSDFGRIAACGSIASYNDEKPSSGPRNLFKVVTSRINLQGFIVMDHTDARGEFFRAASKWYADGGLVARETVVDGLDHAVDAFLDLHRGGNIGKMLVRVG